MDVEKAALRIRIQELEQLLKDQEARAAVTIGHLVRKAGGSVTISQAEIEAHFEGADAFLQIYVNEEGAYVYKLARERRHLTLVQDTPKELM